MCKEGAEEWKVKGGLEAGEKAGLENLEDGFQMNLELAASRPKDARLLAEVKEVFEKKGSTFKAGRHSGEKSHCGGKKSNNSGNKSDDVGRKSNGGGEKLHGGGKKFDDGGKKSDGGGKKSNGDGKKSDGCEEKSNGGEKASK